MRWRSRKHGQLASYALLVFSRLKHRHNKLLRLHNAAVSNKHSQLGLQQAGLGQLQQQLNLGDVKTLEALGARDQALQQQVLEAQRQSNLQLQQFPYQQFAFLSDVYKGTPSSQQVTQTTQTQDPSTFQQIAGLGIAGLSAAAGAKNLGLGF